MVKREEARVCRPSVPKQRGTQVGERREGARCWQAGTTTGKGCAVSASPCPPEFHTKGEKKSFPSQHTILGWIPITRRT